MALPNLTGQYIQDTYQRVLQVSGSGDIVDGTGSLFIPPNAISASYATSASHEIIKEISSSHADTASFAQSGDGIFSGSFSGSYVGDGSSLTGVSAFPFVGDAQITGSLLISGSATPGLTIEGPIQVNHSGSPSAVFTSYSDTQEQVLIYDSKITVEDSNQELAVLSANEYGSRNGILKLANWTSGIVGVSLTAGAYRNFLKGQLVVGKAFAADNTVHGHTLDVSGSTALSGSLSVDGTTRTLFTSCSLAYSGSNVTQVTQSFQGGTQQITNITYSGSFADGNPLEVSVTGSDGVSKLYTMTYSASLVTQILVT